MAEADRRAKQPRQRRESFGYPAPARETGRSGPVVSPLTPPALWRLIEIGERAGLSRSAHRPNLVKAFVRGSAIHPAVARVLRAFDVDATGFFVLVALFAARGRPLDIAALSGETLADRAELGGRVAELARKGILSCAPGLRNRVSIRLTPEGRQTAVFAVYRVIDAAKLG